MRKPRTPREAVYMTKVAWRKKIRVVKQQGKRLTGEALRTDEAACPLCVFHNVTRRNKDGCSECEYVAGNRLKQPCWSLGTSYRKLVAAVSMRNLKRMLYWANICNGIIERGLAVVERKR